MSVKNYDLCLTWLYSDHNCLRRQEVALWLRLVTRDRRKSYCYYLLLKMLLNALLYWQNSCQNWAKVSFR